MRDALYFYFIACTNAFMFSGRMAQIPSSMWRIPSKRTLLRSNSNITVPLSDRRKYDTLQLQNGILVILVTDEISEKSSAALCVSTGAAFDPITYPGLAHFTEHVRKLFEKLRT